MHLNPALAAVNLNSYKYRMNNLMDPEPIPLSESQKALTQH